MSVERIVIGAYIPLVVLDTEVPIDRLWLPVIMC